MVREIERRRAWLGWPMWMVEERAGLSEGYFSKILHGERMASWDLLNRIVVAMMWGDVKVKLHTQVPRGAALSLASMENVNEAARTYLRSHLLRIASQGGFARAESLTPEQRRAIAWKAARVRWGKPDKPEDAGLEPG